MKAAALFNVNAGDAFGGVLDSRHIGKAMFDLLQLLVVGAGFFGLLSLTLQITALTLVGLEADLFVRAAKGTGVVAFAFLVVALFL